MNLIFFGSFLHYSTLVLEALVSSPRINVQAVVTTPPKPAGRNKVMHKTHTHEWAKKHHLPVIHPDSLDNSSLKSLTTDYPLPTIDYFLIAGYGKILPENWLAMPSIAPLNLHFSLLPKYRGANPAEWAILCGELRTGITLMKMNEGLDTGDIIFQKEIAISSDATRESLYQKLYQLGAATVPEQLNKYHAWSQKQFADCQISLTPEAQPTKSPTPYARLLKRRDGFISWRAIHKAISGTPLSKLDFNTTLFSQVIHYLESKTGRTCQNSDYINLLERASRALYGYPGLWTSVPTTKGKRRLKIHSCHLDSNKHLVLDRVQLEGQQVRTFNQIKNQIIL